MANTHGTPIWYELQTPDPDASAAFYGTVMGWTIGGRPTGDMDYRMIETATGNVGGFARLNPAIPGAPATPGWLMYLGVDDVDAAADIIRDAGGSVAMGPFDLPGTGRFAKVADPQGVPFYVMRGAREEETSDVFSPTATARVNWNELATGDLTAAVAFYEKLFGWRVTGTMPMGGDMGDYCFLSLGDVPMGAAMKGMAGATPGWRFYVRVPDIDAGAAAITAGGGTVLHGPVTVPNGDHVVMALDPDGAPFGLVGVTAAAA